MKTNNMKTIEIDGKSYLIDIEKAEEQKFEDDQARRAAETQKEMRLTTRLFFNYTRRPL